MIKWKNVSSKRNDNSGIWQAHFGKYRLTVHKHIYYPPERWLVSTHPDLFTTVLLDAKDLEGAKKEAVVMLKVALEQVLDSIKEELA
jgi:hypothetical protein